MDDLITLGYSFDICFKNVWKCVKLLGNLGFVLTSFFQKKGMPSGKFSLFTHFIWKPRHVAQHSYFLTMFCLKCYLIFLKKYCTNNRIQNGSSIHTKHLKFLSIFDFLLLFGCPSANFGPFSRGQPH